MLNAKQYRCPTIICKLHSVHVYFHAFSFAYLLRIQVSNAESLGQRFPDVTKERIVLIFKNWFGVQQWHSACREENHVTLRITRKGLEWRENELHCWTVRYCSERFWTCDFMDQTPHFNRHLHRSCITKPFITKYFQQGYERCHTMKNETRWKCVQFCAHFNYSFP